MPERNPASYQVALRDFRQARKAAAFQQILARIRGKSADLLCYDDVRQQLRATTIIERGLQEIPLDAIVGSVGRSRDFTRSFLPKRDSDEERWANVKAAVQDMVGMAPIEVYQVGEAYFVKDGNHRVSVARQLGSQTISAYVTEVKTRVPLTADDDPDEVICKARYATFLEKTDLDRLRPDADLQMTFCGHFQVLLDQIETERQLLTEAGSDSDLDEAAQWATAVVHWYDQVYMPVVALIRELGMLREFPERTEADIYMLLSERRAELERALGWEIDPKTAVADLADEKMRPRHLIARMSERLMGAVRPDLEDGPAPGRWRQRQLAMHREDHLFADILVALEGTDHDWLMLDQVIRIAQWDRDRLLGLHVVARKELLDSPQTRQIEATFKQRCQAAGLVGEFAVEVGPVAPVLVRRAAWADLVVVRIDQSPAARSFSRAESGLNLLIQQCPRPILAMPDGTDFDLDRALLAYDGSPKAEEALFVAAYLAIRWQIHLTVVTVETARTTADALAGAEAYLKERGIDGVEYVLQQGEIGAAILKTADTHQANLIIVGGFGLRRVKFLLSGSALEQVLRSCWQPVLICR